MPHADKNLEFRSSHADYPPHHPSSKMATQHQQQLDRVNNTFSLRRTEIIGKESSKILQVLEINLSKPASYYEVEVLKELLRNSQAKRRNLDGKYLVDCMTALCGMAIIMLPWIVWSFRKPTLDEETIEGMMALRILRAAPDTC